ncbi:MAG: 2-C-methyl-D-erythritol 4-phosphate cytidylyltransferase [Lachnospiraceae bacterium]|nr:2-C-methyl-D-erythritol 4-phosphate cytidylyltransferase [Lachnospiraceae bacterium]
MNIAVIFAGGSGKRMHSKDKPKQFLLVHGKPIIVHTIEVFQYHKEIDGIIVVCLEDWIPYMEEMQYRYRLDKIGKIVPGGATGQMSIYNGVKAAAELYGLEDNIVLIHDGVRPLIDNRVISENISGVKEYGSAITCAPAQETCVLIDDNNDISEVENRKYSRLAKAPESFWLNELLEAEEQAIKDGYTEMIDSCTLMRAYGKKMHVVECSGENIKITTPDDFYMFRALYDARENQQLS